MTVVLVCVHDPCLFDCTLEGWALSVVVVVVVVVFVSFRFESCSSGFRPPREALLLSSWFRPPGEALLCSSGFFPPWEAGAASTISRLPAGKALRFVPGVSSPRGSSSLFLGFRPPREAGTVSMMPQSPAGFGRRYHSVRPYA